MDKEPKEQPKTEPPAKPDKEETPVKAGAGVTIPEDFQQHVHKVVQAANTEEKAAHLAHRANLRENEHRDARMKKAEKGNPKEFSSTDMPMD